VANPSQLFLRNDPIDVPGRWLFPVWKAPAYSRGTPGLGQPHLLWHAPAHGHCVDPNRVSLLVAVLEKKVGMNLAQQDIFVNVAVVFG